VTVRHANWFKPTQLSGLVLAHSRSRLGLIRLVGAAGVLFESYDGLPRRPHYEHYSRSRSLRPGRKPARAPDIEKPEGRKKAVAGVEIGMMPGGQGSTFEPEEDREPQG
jgi:hypothetical protein